jgi:hypothetical protein
MLETLPNSLSTYQGAMSNLTGSLLSQFGSQNAAMPGAETLNPSQGKTPQAIDLYADKEATRDGSELRHMESALEQLMDGFSSLIVNIGTEDIPIQLFADDLEEIMKSGMGDVQELVSGLRPDPTGSTAELRIKPGALKGVEYRFNITASSTTKQNKDKALAGIERLLGVIGKFQNLFKDDQRIEINFPQIMQAYEQMADIPGAAEFITFNPDAPRQPDAPPPPPPKQPFETLSYKDAPEDIRRQMEVAAGMEPSQMGGNPTIDQMMKGHEQDHKHDIEKAKLALEAEKQHNETVKTDFEQDQAVAQHEQAGEKQAFEQSHQAAQFAQSTVQSEKSHELASKTADQKAKTDQAKIQASKASKGGKK